MFHLKSQPNKSGSRYIYLQFSTHGKVLRMGTGLSIKPEHWDFDRKLPKRSFPYYHQYKTILSKYEEITRTAYLDLLNTQIPNPDSLKTEILRRLEQSIPATVSGYADRFVQDRKGGLFKRTSIQVYSRTADLIREYDKLATFDQVTDKWLEGFKAFLFRKGFEQNTAAKVYTTLYTILRQAIRDEVSTNDKYKNVPKIPRVVNTEVFLDVAEIERFSRTNVPNMQKIRARDVFTVMCFTGVRISDVTKITRNNLKEHKGIRYFTFSDFKEGNIVEIPLHPIASEIMERYNFSLPKIGSEQRFRGHIKDICQLAKIDQTITAVSHPGGKRTYFEIPKYEMVSPHTARRSLVCNMLLAGIPRETIKSVTGHKSDEAFQSYIRLTPRDHLEIAYKSDFYSAKSKLS